MKSDVEAFFEKVIDSIDLKQLLFEYAHDLYGITLPRKVEYTPVERQLNPQVSLPILATVS